MKVIKRTGLEVEFDMKKISEAVGKAMEACGYNGPTVVHQGLLLNIETAINKVEKESINIEEIQEIVENELIKLGLADVVKSYIKYRYKRQMARSGADNLLEARGIAKRYLDREDWEVKENSNMEFSVQGMNNRIISAITEDMWLNSIYPEKIKEAHTKGDLHLHDLGLFASYCCGWDLADLLRTGFGGVPNKPSFAPPKHFASALGQVVNFLYTLQGEAAGAQAFSSIDTYLAPFIRVDKLDYEQVKQAMQTFVCNLNVSTRVGFQCMSEDTEILTNNGWKKHNEVQVGDTIKTFNINSQVIEDSVVERMFAREYEGVMYNIKNRIQDQLISPKHRMVEFCPNTGEYKLTTVEDIKNRNEKFTIPMSANNNKEENTNLSDNQLIRVTELTENILIELRQASQRQAKLFIDNLNNEMLNYKKYEEFIEELIIKAGYGFTAENGNISVVNDNLVEIDKIEEVEYKGIIWCPTTANNTVIARRNGKSFITGNTPFTNITLDVVCPNHMKEEYVMVGGKYTDYQYGDFQKEMDMFNKAFCEVMLQGDDNGRIYSFPIPTYNVTEDFTWDTEVGELVLEMTMKYGTPYFSNFINSDMSPEDVRSMCCRLRLSNTELRKRGGGLFGANPLTGSIHVSTINLARLGYRFKGDKEGYINEIYRLMELAKEGMVIKRKILEEYTERGLYPYSKIYLANVKEATGTYWGNHFNTIGINGMNESIRNFTGDTEDITTDWGREFAETILDKMNERMVELQEETGFLFNLEATPAEATAYRLAQKDKKEFPDIITAGTAEVPYYTNSTQLPVGFTEDLFEALRLQEKLQTMYTGGTVLHGFFKDRVEETDVLKSLIKKVLTNYKIPYFTYTPTFSVCKNHGYLIGEQAQCPECGETTEIWTRVVGFHRPVQNWNDGKQQEYIERKEFSSKK